MPFKKPNYPSSLKKSEWTKNKDIVTEIVKGKTGLGKILDSIESDYKTIDFSLADTIGKKQFKSPDEPATKKFVGAWNNLIDHLSELTTMAREVGNGLRKSKVTPKKTADYIDEMIGDATDLRRIFAAFQGG